MAYSFSGGCVKLWLPGQNIPEAFYSRNTVFIAHNAGFEKLCLQHLKIPVHKMHCTMSVCSYLALPASLKEASKALNLTESKDVKGSRLISDLCTPKKPSMKDPNTRRLPELYPEKFQQLYDYCMQDVTVLKELHAIVGELPEDEYKLWELTNKINDRGLKLDENLIGGIYEIYEAHTKKINEDIKVVTKGKINSINQTVLIKQTYDNIDTLTKDGVAELLNNPNITEEERQVLLLRQAGSKTSLAKLSKMIDTKIEGYVYDNIVYHGATTGRWAGRGLQPQNLPRNELYKINLSIPEAIDMVKKGKLTHDAMKVLPSLLRPCIIGNPTLSGADYSQIEPRVLAWVANQEDLLNEFRTDGKVYEHQASFTYNVPLEEVTKEQRQMGKKLVLGCGYGMGATKFQFSCQPDCSPTLEFCKEAVHSYRKKNYMIVNEWYSQMRAVKACIANKTTIQSGKVTWDIEGDFLRCKLPSGRYLHYNNPTMALDEWGNYVPHIKLYKAVWGKRLTIALTTTMIIENIVQAISRDIMAHAMLKLEENNMPVIMTVHDEIICDTDKDITGIMCELPSWAKDIPVKAEGWIEQRYCK